MAKRSERRAPRGADNGTRRREETVEAPWRRWWNGATKTVLGAGALASAVAAILSLWPGPDEADAAKLAAVRIAHEVPFSEYRQRLVAAHGTGEDTVGMGSPVGGLRLAAATPSAYEPGPEPEPQPEPEPSDTGPPAGEPTATPEPVSPPVEPPQTGTTPPERAAVRIESAFGAGGPGIDRETLCAHPEMAPYRTLCESNTDGMTNLANGQRAGTQTAPAPSISIAPPAPSTSTASPASTREVSEVVNILKKARTAPAAEGEPVGVVVAVDIELTGMRDRPALLSWSMWQHSGANRLHGEWLNTNLAYRLVASSERDTASVDFWIPLPPAPGPYFVRSMLTVDGVTVASADSEAFL